jgi:NhaP-type Na+/H+ or K+/H+ antiporter
MFGNFFWASLAAKAAWYSVPRLLPKLLFVLLALYLYGAYLNDNLGPGGRLLGLLLGIAVAVWVLRMCMSLKRYLVGSAISRYHRSGHVKVRVDLDGVG